MFLSKFCYQEPKFKRKFQVILEFAFWKKFSFHPASNGERLRDIQHKMSMILGTRFHIWFILRLYCKMRQKFKTKYDSCFITKCDRSLIQNVSGFYCKIRSFYYKMRQLLQIATILLKNATFIKKRDVYYKLRQYVKQ